MRDVFAVGEFFPQRLEKIILAKDLSYSQIHKDTGIAVETIRRWRRGLVHPERRRLYRFCRTYEIPVGELVRRPGEAVLGTPDIDTVRLGRFIPELELLERNLSKLEEKHLKLLLGRLRVTLKMVKETREEKWSSPSTTRTKKSGSSNQSLLSPRAVPQRIGPTP